MKTFLDTNVFLYAIGGPHAERDACARVLRRVADGSLEATIDSEVLQEILYVLVRRDRRREGTALLRHLAALFPDLLPVTRADMLLAADLVERIPRLGVRDAVHAATMITNGVRRIVSVDEDFDGIEEIRRVSPSEAR